MIEINIKCVNNGKVERQEKGYIFDISNGKIRVYNNSFYGRGCEEVLISIDQYEKIILEV